MAYLSLQQALDLALDQHRAGRHAEAEALYRQLLAFQPENADLIHLIGCAAHDARRFPEALNWMQRAIALQPQVARYYNNLGLLLTDLQRFDEAVAAFETGLRLDPASAEILYNLGNTRGRQQQWDAAIAAYRQALQLRPNHGRTWLNLGLVLASSGRREAAIDLYHEAQRQCPGYPAFSINLGGILNEQGRLDEAIAEYRSALALLPDDAFTWNNLGVVLKDSGRIGEALAAMRQSANLLPENAEIHSNLIFTLLFDPRSAAEVVREELRRWNARHVAPQRAQRRPHPNDRTPGRRLRIGYVSADFRSHPVGRTFLPIFEAHDRREVECVCYSGGPNDGVSGCFRARADLWREVSAATHAELADQVRADGIDILVDLGLHTSFNRLPAFALKPAPVQVSWLGYPGTNGLETMDYHLTDRFLDPPAAETAEAGGQPCRLPDAWCCYPAPDDAPEVGPLPAATTGRITFGSCNNFSKINEPVLDLWARILRGVPESRLLMLVKSGSHQDHTRAFLEERGIAASRVEFLGYEPASSRRSTGDYLRRYAQIDIALDPFPYNGMTTTGDALWMGVPVITLIGAAAVGRASFSLLSTIGLPELAAASEDAYERLAIDLASDPARLAQLRATLRDRMKNSPLLDTARFARNLEAAYRQMWERWCAGHGGL